MRLAYRLFVFVSSLFVALYGILPGLFRIQGDFVANFVAGRNFVHGMDPVLFYHFPVLQKLIDLSGLSGSMASFVTSSPSSIMIDAVLGVPPASIGRFLLTAANVVALVMIVHATAKIAGASNRTTYFVFLCSSFALAANFQSSAPFIMLTLLLVLAFYAYSINSVAACGVFLGLAFPFNPVLAVPAILFLVSARWRAVTYFLSMAFLILALTYVVVGQSALVYYFQRILPSYLNGRVLNPFSDSYQTAWSFFRRLFLYNDTLNLHPLFKSDVLYLLISSGFKSCVVVPPAYFFYKGISRGKAGEALAAATFPLIFLSTMSTTPELVMLAPAIVILTQAAMEEGRKKTASAFVILYAITCLPIYSFAAEYLSSPGLLLNYERFFLLIATYVLYLIFQSRIVPAHVRALRLALTVVVIVAVTVPLYLGDQVVHHSTSLPIKAVLKGPVLQDAAFSPGYRNGNLTYISADSASSLFTATGIDNKDISSQNIFGYSSGAYGKNYGLETTKSGAEVVYFKTRSASATFRGHEVSLSRDEDYGAFVRNGIIHVVDLDPRFIAPVDTLSLLPYRIRECSFNSSRNYEIVFVIDSLNSSYSLASYNLFSRKIKTIPSPFRVSLMCADADSFYVTRNVSDTTSVWKLVNALPPVNLFSLRAEITDLTVLNRSLFFSSDFERGLDNPTVYRYTGRMEADRSR